MENLGRRNKMMRVQNRIGKLDKHSAENPSLFLVHLHVRGRTRPSMLDLPIMLDIVCG